MAWIAAAIVFCFFMWKWPRRTLKGLGICAIIGAVLAAILVGAMKYQDYKKDELRKAIKMSIEYSPHKCRNDKYPLAIEIINDSNTKVYKIDFSVRAYAPGRSTNLIDDYGGGYYSDYILEPNKRIMRCYQAPKIEHGYSPEKLDWKAYVTWVETSGR